ncbi:hypothetical protein WA026_003305 [Henosepilachna vigintioctopunctata]|uniref:Multidrug resistance-associated protein 4-like n=1 Tax=Henosepilachna vigintioctopunctata TaxID=420089 RepID=A0AAW1TNI2_9CUCU
MEESYPIERESPKKNANFLSRIFFFWMKRICYEGCTKGIELKNLYKIQEPNKSSYLTEHLEKIWDDEVQKGKLKERKPSLLKALFRAYTFTFLLWGILIFINSVVVKTVQPLMLSGLIKLFTNGGYTPSDVLFYGGGLCLLTLLNAFLNHHTNCGVNIIGMRVRVAISSLVYRKILRLSQLSLGKTAAGKVVNLLSNDVARFDLIVFGLNHLWVGPFQILVVACLMWMQMGPSSMTAIVSVIVLTLPLQLMMGSITSKYRMQVAKKTDNRVKIMSELLAGVQVIKMYSWETPFEAVVEKARIDEVKWLTKTSYVRGVLSSFTDFVEKAALCATIVCFVILGQGIRADLVFALDMYISILNLTLSIIFPIVIAMGAECLVSVKRLEEFLLMEEKETLQILPVEDKHVYLKNINSYWVHDTPVLKNLSIKLAPGTLCAVIGPVGSGKSSLLKLLLGEMMTSSGTIEYSGDISYASQEPWLFASTVRNNILFGEKLNREHYKNVVRVCALERDFELFPDGDKTKVGDRGVSLSGGQRARINLARCVYKDADIYLLDDPLSAVDTKVGRHLFDQCIMDFLKGKTRILVTHQLQYLKKADAIIVLNKGGIEAQGTFETLSQSDSEFTKLLVAADESHEHEKSEKITRASTVSVSTIASLNAEPVEEEQDSEEMEDEGGYKGSPGWAYIRRFGGFLTIFFITFLFLLCQVLLSGSDYWITYWSNQEELRDKANNINASYQFTTAVYTSTKIEENITNLSELPEFINGQLISNITRSRSTFFEDIERQFTETIILDDGEHTLLTKEAMTYIYAFIVIVLIVITLVRSIMFFHGCMQASKKLHNNMFHCLLKAPMRFFDTNPAGRILNRFSKDIGAVDEMLPRALMDVVQILLIMFGILVLVVISNVYMIVIIVILGGIFFQIRKWYISTARSIKLIEGVAKSPVFSYINSSINGLTTIRATHNEEVLKKQFDDHQDVHTAAWYLQVMCSVSYGLWLDLICALFVCFVIIGFIVLDQFTTVQGSLIGLGISQASALVGMLQFCMRQISECVNYLTSVERVLQYTQLEQEHPLLTAKR